MKFKSEYPFIVDEKLSKSLDRDKLLESRELVLSLITYAGNLLREQEYDKIKGEIGEDYIKNLDKKILWLTISQMVIVIGGGGWIIYTIRNYINDK